MTIYYTYYSYEEFGRGYIGYRKCPEHLTPETDPYLGSYTDKKFKPTHKIILGTYDNRTEAIADEIVLHKAYDMVTNPHFANRARMTSVGFSTAGTALSAEHRAKLSENNGMKRPEVAAKASKTRRKKAKCYNWENIFTGETHVNLCIAELRDLHANLDKSALGKVVIGLRKYHKGWTIQP